ncbi:MAG: preprotein translocase subunit SecE [Clostridia bacterium]
MAKDKDQATLPVKGKKSHAPDKKPSWGARFWNGCKALPKRMWNSIQNTVSELKKVTWPSKQDLINYTTVVVVFMVLMAVVVGLLDMGASGLVSLLIKKG